MWEVILGAAIALVVSVVAQWFQNHHQEKTRERLILFELHSVLQKVMIDIDTRNKLKLNKSPIKVIDEMIIENIREITSFSFQLTSLRYAELAYEITDMCTDGINFSSIAKMDEITEKVQYAMNKKLAEKFNKSTTEIS